ncbi:MAG: hypothetical protein WB947_07785, partial [Thermoplasmata archaeon]
MRIRRNRSRFSPGTTLVALALVAVALLASVPASAWASAPTAPRATIHVGPSVGPLTATAVWNGVNVVTADTVNSAFHITFGNSVNVNYTWSQNTGVGGPGAAWSINDARLQIFYFGFALGTRDVTTTVGQTSGTIFMSNWNTGALEYIVEGTFMLTASLIATNGTTAWSQSFWVDVAAAYYILAALPIVLILIAIYEIYNVATVGRQQALKQQKKEAPPPATPAASPPAGVSGPPPSAPPPPTPA